MYSAKPLLHKRQKEYVPGNMRTMVIDVTSKCGMACPHCYAQTFQKVQAADLAVLKKALGEAYDLGVFHYVMMGGEPIEDPERLEQVIKLCRPEESFINVVSNGWLMTVEKISWLKDLGVDKIAFSLDSGIEAEHDSNRKKGSFERVRAAIDNTLAEGLLASISIVVTHQSLHTEGFTTALEYAKEKGLRMDIQVAMPVGRWDGKTDMLISEEDAKYIRELSFNGPLIPNGQRLVNRDTYSPQIYGGCDHCPAGTEFLSLSVNGELLPCNFLQFSLGNIRDKSIGEMRQDLLTSPWFDGKHQKCLCGEDREFIARYISAYVGEEKPLDANKIFGLQGGK